MINKILNIKKPNLAFVISMVLFFSFVGCDQQSVGFALPEGDAGQGELLFSSLRCNECHSTRDVKWLGNYDDLHVPLGGKTTRVKGYGELVTSIINPSHKIAKEFRKEGATDEGMSKMMIYNEIITVQELIDIVTYLQGEFEIVTPSNDYYPHYF